MKMLFATLILNSFIIVVIVTIIHDDMIWFCFSLQPVSLHYSLALKQNLSCLICEILVFQWNSISRPTFISTSPLNLSLNEFHLLRAVAVSRLI